MADSLQFTTAQQKAIDHTGEGLLVAAAAGSGKTRVLVERLMKQITDAAHPSSVTDYLVITFTKAAAAELRGKIADALAARLAEEPNNRYLRRELTLCSCAEIGTIHSFCARLLREKAYILGISPDFRVADESECELIRWKILEEVLEKRYANIQSCPSFAALTDLMSAGWNDKKLSEMLLDIHSRMQSVSYPEKWRDEQLRELSLENVQDVGETVWGQYLLAQANANAAYYAQKTGELLDEADTNGLFQKKYGEAVRDLHETILCFQKALSDGWDAAAAFYSYTALRPKGMVGNDELKQRWKECKNGFSEILSVLNAPSEVLLADMRHVQEPMRELLRLVFEYDEAYSQEKRRRNLMDFSDLEHFSVRLLCDPVTEKPTKTAVELSRKYREILVDEYQDVNRVQDTLFHALSKQGKNLFFVGDVKQSIYRFRLADPTVFLEKYDRFQKNEGGKCVVLSQNFRSRKTVLEAVNWIFENIMSRELGEMEYTEQEKLYPGADYPENQDMQTELCVVDVPSQEEDGETTDKDHAEAAYVAGRIREMAGRLMISDGRGGQRPAEYGDFTILMRSYKKKRAIYAEALAEQGIPVVSGGNTSLLEQSEVREVLSLLTVVSNPMEDIPLISVLRSALFGFPADLLGKIRTYGNDSFLEALEACAEDGDDACSRFLNQLADFREAAEYLSASELLQYIYVRTGIPGIYSAMSGGIDRRENLWRLTELLRELEANGYRGLYACMTHLRELIEKNQLSGEEGVAGHQNAVEITSIHHSKGLEYPVVFLTDLSHQFNMDDMKKPLLFHQKLGFGPRAPRAGGRVQVPTVARDAIIACLKNETLSEEMRLLYVGMTRAREKLVMTCAFHNAEKKLSDLWEEHTVPVPSQRLSECRSVAEWILLAAFGRRESASLFGEAPGEAYPFCWKMSRVTGEKSAPFPVPSEIVYSPETEESGLSLEKILKYEYPCQAAEAIPSKLTATELKGRAKDEEANLEAVSLTASRKTGTGCVPDFLESMTRLSAAERGTAVHLALQYADGKSCFTVEEAERELDRLLTENILTRRQRQAIDSRYLVHFWTSSVGKRVLASEKVCREFKFSLLVDAEAYYPGGAGEKILLQGVVDCFFEEAGELVLLDFKTDFTEPGGKQKKAEQYRIQLETYADSLEHILKMKVSEKIVFFLRTGTAVTL